MNTIPELIEDIRQGKMVILMDDEDRENEGDLIMAASHVTPEAINFMARFGRGLICLTLTGERARKLQLTPMVHHNETSHHTNFTVSIEARKGVTTGISAADRAHTILTAVAEDAKASDLVHPGHIFPLIAKDGGVLTRAGHTEAGCDLAKLAGLEPASTIVEILNEDGSMARRDDLLSFAKTHQLKIGTIADLIQYRMQNEKTVERVASRWVESQHALLEVVIYIDNISGALHYGIVKGPIDPKKPSYVRVHAEDRLLDLLHLKSSHERWPLDKALQKISEVPQGVLVFLSEQMSSRQQVERLADLETTSVIEYDERKVGVGSQILADLGVKEMIVLSSPKKYPALSGFDLSVLSYEEFF